MKNLSCIQIFKDIFEICYSVIILVKIIDNRTIFNLDSAVRCLKSLPAMKLDE